MFGKINKLRTEQKSRKVFKILSFETVMKFVLGYIYTQRGFDKEDGFFIKLAGKKNIELVMFNTEEEIDKKTLEVAKGCDLIFNNSVDEFAIELTKTFESFGKKVIEPSEVYYDIEDKWLFYLKCRKNKIPTPETILLSENMNAMKRELKKFGHWPVVLKRVEGTCGKYVEKADNFNEAVLIINKFQTKGNERLPVIAQEFISSPCYRITMIGNKVVQTALKRNQSWKATGVYGNHFDKFEIDDQLDKIVKKVAKAVGISICGIDLLKKDGKWAVLEVNSSPGLDFFDDEHEELVGEVLDFLKNKAEV
jgi:ribosomal protein S6--L-glutamate ligase